MEDSTLVPVYLRKRLLRYATEEFLRRHKHHFELVTNRRGHIKRASCKQTQTCDVRPNSIIGLHFVQHLEHGACYALHGTSGSQ